MRAGQLGQMTICSLVWAGHPGRQSRNVMSVGEKLQRKGGARLQHEEQGARLGYGLVILRNLGEYADKAEFRNGAGEDFRRNAFRPKSDSIVKLMVVMPERDQRIYVKQIFHGKNCRSSATCLLVRTGAFLPALNTGSPVIGSVTIRTLKRASARGLAVCFAGLAARSRVFPTRSLREGRNSGVAAVASWEGFVGIVLSILRLGAFAGNLLGIFSTRLSSCNSFASAL